VHDIGKNIVGVVLGCNNYEIIDLGVMVPSEHILSKARDENVDMIGLSGLITPSLDEMVHVAKEMEREGFEIPLLIGGATTSKAHTAVKIDGNYNGPVVHVHDASKAVSVSGQLLNKKMRSVYLSNISKEYDRLRENYNRKNISKKFFSLEEARKNKPEIDWQNMDIRSPKFLGIGQFDNYPLEKISKYIDWTPFFIAWEMKGKYPRIFENEKYGKEAQKLFDDAQDLLENIINSNLLTAKAIYGIFPANSDVDDIILYGDDKRDIEIATLHTLRQQEQKDVNIALSDFIAPTETKIKDYIGAFAVTTGIGLDELVNKFNQNHDDYNAIMAKALADRLAEAFAELLHEKIRKEIWGYNIEEDLSNEDLISEKYTGIRPAPGYPAQPDHTEKLELFKLLDVESKIGISLTESLAMDPAASVCGFYFANPNSKYFNVGKIDRDQLVDYANRKSISSDEAEKWLNPILTQR
ncbi:MAG: vitamin B12 dependent-methionine synthase activation domain-containing protein, partial [Melioribacteraceae bacterium]|nr:vitamin B12 dependent-methionine synthase activation domain-containing protein [Melioribacteraceae bacterium]